MSLSPEQMGSRAKELLTNEAFKDAIETARRQVYAAVVSCDAKDDLGRYRYTMAAKLIDGVERHLKHLLESAPGEPEPDVSSFYSERARSMLSFFK